MYILAPSILSADFANLGLDVQVAVESGARYIHIDVMDGQFVPRISLGDPVIASLRKVSDAFFDVHLMVEEPGRFTETFKNAGADAITVHVEACEDLPATLKGIHEAGLVAGVSLNPETPVSAIEAVLDQVDVVLVMSVHPGKGGQKFIPESLQKIRDIRRMLDEKGLTDVDIEVDGGISAANLKEVIEAGANIFVAGSAVFGGDIRQKTLAMMNILNEYSR